MKCCDCTYLILTLTGLTESCGSIRTCIKMNNLTKHYKRKGEVCVIN